MKIKNNLSRAIFAFLTAFFLFCAILSWVLFAASHSSTLFFAARVGKFHEKAALEAEEGLNHIALAGGFGEGFFDGTVTAKNVEASFKPFVNSAFKGESYAVKAGGVESKISEKIFSAAEEKMPGYSMETRDLLNNMVSLCTATFSDVASPRLIRHLCAFFGRFKEAFALSAGVFSLLFLSSFFILKKQSLKFLKTSLISAAFMLGIGPTVIMLFLRNSGFGIESQSVRDLILCFLFSMLAALVVLAAIILLLSLFITKKHPVST